MNTARRRSIAAAGVLLIGLSACSTAVSEAPSTQAMAPALTGSITVFAAASLKTTFTQLATTFEAANPELTVQLNFAGSSDLVTQIVNGAPADVIASADETNMAKLTGADLIEGAPVDFATNVLEIAVPPSNPAGISNLADLAREGVATVLCAPQVPCGAAAAAVETAGGIDIRPVSEETSVTDVLGKVTSGEADAGLVYVTDIAAAGDAVLGIPFPESAEAVNTYPIAALRASSNPEAAAAFAAFVAGQQGHAVLTAAGFGSP